MLGKKGFNQFTKAKSLGLPKPVISEETREKYRVNNKKRVWTAEKREKHSEAMLQAVKDHPESYTSSNRGRTKQFVVDGIKLLGKWEVDFYIWAKEAGLNPKRPIECFPYEWNGTRSYFPDFYIESLDLYVEVKGYETERDRAKWLAFPKKLRIIKRVDIKEIREKSFKGL